MVARDRLITAAVMGVSAALPVMLVFLMLRYGVKSPEAFSFLGALGGAAVTVALAMWVDGRKARAQRALEAGVLREELATMRSFADELIARVDLAATEPATEVDGALETLVGANGYFALLIEEGLTHGQTLTFTERMRLRHCRDVANAFNAFTKQWDQDGPVTLHFLLPEVRKLRTAMEGAINLISKG